MEKIKCERCKGNGLDPELDENQQLQLCKKCLGTIELDWITNVTGISLSRQQKSILFVINTLNELVDLDILTGGPLEINEKFKPIAKNFKPTEEEIRTSILILKYNGYL